MLQIRTLGEKLIEMPLNINYYFVFFNCREQVKVLDTRLETWKSKTDNSSELCYLITEFSQIIFLYKVNFIIVSLNVISFKSVVVIIHTNTKTSIWFKIN